MMNLEWMAWTAPTAIFFAVILLLLLGMTLWQFASPTTEQRGFLPIVTTRGDRLFIGLLTGAYIHLAWLGLTDYPLWWATIAMVVCMIILMRWG
ncbi:MAG: DUF2160 domain-containing protein [Candidatus Tectomicrobia bacterium]|nr:DUF2160 domain-containing protein [Candidatus Tectomicrobia bacterium]